MAAESRNPRDESSDAGMVRSSITLPQWLIDEIDRIVDRRLTNRSAVIREAILAWLPSQKEEAA
jgi:metal-responsive CopG/Arc/MetJ family transcriptional regulator